MKHDWTELDELFEHAIVIGPNRYTLTVCRGWQLRYCIHCIEQYNDPIIAIDIRNTKLAKILAELDK